MRNNVRAVAGIGLGMMLWGGALAACGSSDESTPAGTPQGACWPTDPSCMLPNNAGFQCLALAENTGDVWSFRMSQLQVLKPSVLAGRFLQDTVVTKGISLDMPMCLQEGTGRFSWLMRLDSNTNKATTGGGHIQKNPYDGYCFIQEEVAGFMAQPMEIDLTTTVVDGEVQFELTQPIADLNVPIYLNDEETSAIIMPLHEVLMSEGRISADHNCIGSWDGDGLDPVNNCKPDRNEGQSMQWKNGAKLTGYITIEEADRVWIPEMTQTLCVALSGSAPTYGEDFEEGDRKGKRCKRDENDKILAAEKADWCSTTNAACVPPDADAFRLEGMFAASAVKILDACP